MKSFLSSKIIRQNTRKVIYKLILYMIGNCLYYSDTWNHMTKAFGRMMTRPENALIRQPNLKTYFPVFKQFAKGVQSSSGSWPKLVDDHMLIEPNVTLILISETWQPPVNFGQQMFLKTQFVLATIRMNLFRFIIKCVRFERRKTLIELNYRIARFIQKCC